MKKPTIAVLGSHSALDVCRGATDLGFKTVVIAQMGREKTYEHYYRKHAKVGCIDECIVVAKFSDILDRDIQDTLKNAIFIPNRAFSVYLNFDYNAIENDFKTPIFGNKYLLKVEERNLKPNQYDLMQKAGIRYPRHFKTPKEIDRLVLVKVAEKERSFERAFFLAKNQADFTAKSRQLIKLNKITNEALSEAVIEEYISGVHVNFNFFYSPLFKRLELLGTDTRRQTNLDGIIRVPTNLQDSVIAHTGIAYEEAGHIAVTVLESMLEPAFALGEAFVKATQTMFAPGIIGPFALQSIITPGPPKKEIIVVDISPRMPGSPGIAATPYSSYLYGQPISAGRRIAMEIQEALQQDKLKTIIT